MNCNKTNSNGIEKMLFGYKKHRVLFGRPRCGIIFIFILSPLFGTSCKKSYLNVVPDNVATIANAFASKIEAEKYLFTCYSYIPNNENPTFNPGISAGDEVFFTDNDPSLVNISDVMQLDFGGQNTSNPIANYMDGTRGANANYKAIRDCNVFLDNVSNPSEVPDLDIDTRTRWIAEVQFLKAYYHFMMFRAYGPIPIIDKNLPISASLDQMHVKRQSVDSVVNYISNLLDVAAAKLPLTITNTTNELGRITSPIALSLKARLLATAASPLFNGNSDYSSFKNADGVALFNPSYSVAKWQRAAAACKAAIDLCATANIKLYTFPAQTNHLSDTTMTEMSIRNAMSEPWNSELIWGLTTNNNTNFIQMAGKGEFDFNYGSGAQGDPLIGPTIKMAKMFYTQNGVPIDEDKTLDFTNIATLRVATHAERFNIKEGETTARLNFDREPRYYADLGFDRGIWYMANSPSLTDENTFYLMLRNTEISTGGTVTPSGMYMKKVLNWHFEYNNPYQSVNYPWPEIRLADIYLLYAEALNEAQGPGSDVYNYVNQVRARAGLQSVQTSWGNFSTNPTKYTTQAGMRVIIQRERSIELCFEGQRYWDLLRWKTAAQELAGNVTGWTVSGKTPDLYYREITLNTRFFVTPRDYLWPIEDQDLLVNPNLVQNPNW
ncbi:RagB/SusD family nutrient uptake outer membrane protein [Mucilaginibacter sp. L196]|uniref:RagB/SusD family nutrient uptake outer membrane protein n=1 Tax=Mucilaginibacter sp. L196 TaxID=1641870 RepID=UPI001C204DD5|nr:RagB/SusD family nutrient uptake outer membrane protein [Mucilaginibacter sp. L196]